MLSQALHAHFADASEQRASDRRVLRLEAQAATPSGQGDIEIHNLSRTGMLFESPIDVPVGAGIEIEMPGGTRHGGEVVWRDAGLVGCRFVKPLSQATLSAALLRAAPVGPPIAHATPAAQNDAMTRLREHWNIEQDAAVAAKSEMSLGSRLWVILGLGLASWAVPTLIIAQLVA